jgi:hypothetical protein
MASRYGVKDLLALFGGSRRRLELRDVRATALADVAASL